MRFLAVASVLAIVAAGPARADESTAQICASPDVLQHVVDALRHAGRSLALEPETVGEVSTSPDGTVHCAVRTHAVVYDTNRYGAVPIDRSTTVQYTLERRRNGMFLHVD